MKKLLLLSLALGLVLTVAPAIAGDDHEEHAYKCNMDTQACLNAMAAKFKGRGWAGVSLDWSEGMLAVKEVHKGTPAAKAGVVPGDVLVAINGIEYADEENYAKIGEFESQMKPGKTFTYTISHEGKKRDVTVTLTEMPMEVIAAMVGAHLVTDHAVVEVATAD